jgi:hypothetical protein
MTRLTPGQPAYEGDAVQLVKVGEFGARLPELAVEMNQLVAFDHEFADRVGALPNIQEPVPDPLIQGAVLETDTFLGNFFDRADLNNTDKAVAYLRDSAASDPDVLVTYAVVDVDSGDVIGIGERIPGVHTTFAGDQRRTAFNGLQRLFISERKRAGGMRIQAMTDGLRGLAAITVQHAHRTGGLTIPHGLEISLENPDPLLDMSYRRAGFVAGRGEVVLEEGQGRIGLPERDIYYLLPQQQQPRALEAPPPPEHTEPTTPTSWRVPISV